MNSKPTSPEGETRVDDPFRVLGVTLEASEAEVRSRYLELVKRYPPDREPEKFREIQAAYELAKDPLVLAGKLLESTGSHDVPSWQSVLDRYAQQPPPMGLALLVSLGNQPPGFQPELPPAAAPTAADKDEAKAT